MNPNVSCEFGQWCSDEGLSALTDVPLWPRMLTLGSRVIWELSVPLLSFTLNLKLLFKKVYFLKSKWYMSFCKEQGRNVLIFAKGNSKKHETNTIKTGCSEQVDSIGYRSECHFWKYSFSYLLTSKNKHINITIYQINSTSTEKVELIQIIFTNPSEYTHCL